MKFGVPRIPLSTVPPSLAKVVRGALCPLVFVSSELAEVGALQLGFEGGEGG